MDDLGKEKQSKLAGGVYRFGRFALDSRKRTLSFGDSPVSLTAKAYDVLLFLTQHPNRLVTKEELLQAVWGDTFVEDGSLTRYVSYLRKALHDASDDGGLIVTIARKGYQFTADVTVDESTDPREQSAVQVSTAKRLLADTQFSLGSLAVEAVPRAPTRWQTAVVVGASVIVLGIASVVAGRHFGSMTPSRPQKVMLAVLPFQNLTGDPDKEYLADGLTEETISLLGRLNPEQLGVIARTSVMGYKHKNERLDQIGRDLSVQYVLENSFRESGDHIRLTAQLIQVKDQTHLWSQDYDYPVKDILNIEDDVARAIAREIRLRLSSQQQAELAQSHPVNAEAFNAYLQAHYFFERNTDKDTGISAKYYERATQLDPSFARAWAGLSRVRKWQASTGLIPEEEGNRLARESAERALALNPNLAEAHIQMGRIQQQLDFDWAGSYASRQRAVELEPGNVDAVLATASSAATLGRFDEALRLSRRAVGLDPLNPSSWQVLGEIELFVGQLDQAAADAKKALELSPDVWPGPIVLSKIYVMLGRPNDALTQIELIRYEPERTYLHAIAYYALGRKKESDVALRELIAKYPRNTYNVADVYAYQSQADEAFRWLERAYAAHSSGLIQLKVDPFLKGLHQDPRFAALLKKLNLPN